MLVGRERELAVLAGSAAAASGAESGAHTPAQSAGEPARVIEIVGPAGIGKSALLATGAERLAGDGFQVVAHRATAPERSLPWAALISLLGQLESPAGRLSASHRQHLRAVVTPEAGDDPRPHGVAVATGELIALAAEAQPLALVVDDAQWVDAPSAAVLTFVARRLDRQRALLLLARDDARPAVVAADVAGASGWQRLELGGLSVDAVAELVRATTGRRLHRAVLLELHERSGGHPQFAVEMATELVAGADRQHALRRRVASDALVAPLAALPEQTLTTLEYAALLAAPTVRALLAATGDEHVVATLEPAEAAGLLRIVPHRGELVVQFAPSVVAAIEQQMSTARRHARHARLADAAAEPIQRAVHLAAAASAPDARLATDIEAGAALALRRGDAVTAARLGEAAVAATPPEDRADVQRRLLALAEAQARGRMAADVLVTLDRIEVAPRSADAARVALMRTPALAEIHGLDVARATADEASGWIDGPLRAELFRLLVALDRLQDIRRSAATAARALDAARDDGSPQWIAMATVAATAMQAAVGEAVDVDAAIAVAGSPQADRLTRNELLHLLWYTGDPRGIEWTERVIAIAGAAGDAVGELNAQMIQANLLIPRGDWQRAEQVAWQALRHGFPDATERALLGFLRAATGRTAQADVIWDELVSAESTRGRTNTVQVEVWRATAAWSSGSADAADRLLRVDELARSIGFAAPRAIAFRRDAVEALVAAGRHDEARAVAARMRADAERNGLANARADADAAEALLAAVGGDDDRAAELIAAAIEVHERYGERYELARSLLASGRLARRAGRRADARRDLQAAVELFESFGATPWVRRAADELQWIGGRSRSATALTETERLIAGHAAAGKTNTEIAAVAFVAVRTVEANLSRVYRKLGIRSRAQLADALRRIPAE